MSYKFTAYFNDEGIYSTQIYHSYASYTRYYGDDMLSYSGFSGSMRFTATAASGYAFYRWVYHEGSITATTKYSTDNPFVYTSEKDIWIRAESVESGGGGGDSGWTQYNAGNIGSVSSKTSRSLSVNAGYVYRYSVKFATSGTASFYTEGSLDTYGYLSTSTGFDSSGGAPSSPIASNDDGDSGYNFKITANVSANTTYYIWVRCYHKTASGSTTLYVEPPGGSSDIPTYTLSNVSSAQSKSISISAGSAARFQITFKNSGSATFYTTGSLDTYGFLSLSATWDSSSRAPSTNLTMDDDSGDGNNFKITYSIAAGTTYYVYVRAYSASASGSTTFCVTPPTATTVAKWNWFASNGSANAGVTETAYNSLHTGGTVADFSYLVWNDLCDKVKAILDYKNETWSTYYGLTLAQTKMSTSDKTLTAARWNSLRYNVGSRYSTGIQEVKPGDTVYASYFTTLTTKINDWIDTL